MINPHHKTIVLVFSNSSTEELKHKQFPNGQSLFDYFNTQTLNKVRKSNLPYSLCTEKEQSGHNFAERLSNAIEALFNKGYENVITIGNDSPKLKARHLLEANENLMVNNTVIGPSLNGGLYLIGLHKNAFNKKAFANLPWKSKNLKSAFYNYNLQCDLKIYSLKYLKDINNLQDLKQFSQHEKQLSYSFKRIIRRLIKVVRNATWHLEMLFDICVTNLPFNKGSPSFAK